MQIKFKARNMYFRHVNYMSELLSLKNFSYQKQRKKRLDLSLFVSVSSYRLQILPKRIPWELARMQGMRVKGPDRILRGTSTQSTVPFDAHKFTVPKPTRRLAGRLSVSLKRRRRQIFVPLLFNGGALLRRIKILWDLSIKKGTCGPLVVKNKWKHHRDLRICIIRNYTLQLQMRNFYFCRLNYILYKKNFK